MCDAAAKTQKEGGNKPTIVGISLYLVYWCTGILFGYLNPDALERVSNPDPDVAFAFTALVWCFAVPMGYVIALKHLSGDGFVRIHARWVERTYWFSLLWMFCAAVLVVVSVIALSGAETKNDVLTSLSIYESSGFLMMAVVFWCFYRIVRGFINYLLGRLPRPDYALNPKATATKSP